MNAVTNALLGSSQNLSKMDFVGPTADDDIRRAINRYGADAVKAAIKRQTKAKIGRPKLNDWKELAPIIEEHADLWLKGEDPFAAYSNYSIAKNYAAANPGQSAIATHKRIERKLKASRHGRKWFTLVLAFERSKDAYPHPTHIRALEELCELDPQFPAWSWHLDQIQGSIADYERLHGEPPPAHLTATQVEEGSKVVNALLDYGKSPRPGGLFGLLGTLPK